MAAAKRLAEAQLRLLHLAARAKKRRKAAGGRLRSEGEGEKEGEAKRSAPRARLVVGGPGQPGALRGVEAGAPRGALEAAAPPRFSL